MLITKTFCRPGSTVYIVPTGLLVTLRYDAHGQLNGIFKGFAEDRGNPGEELPDDFLKAVVNKGLVPGAIKITSTSTIIWGAFYSDEFKSSFGDVPVCEFDRIIADIISGNAKYKFYIGYLESGSMATPTQASLHVWSRMSGFDIMPTWMISTDATDKTLKDYVHSNIHYPFKYPLISGYIVAEGANKPYYYPLHLQTATVTAASKYVNHSGYIKYRVNYGDAQELSMHYPDAAYFNVQKGSQVVLDGDTVIWSNTKSSNHSDRLAKRIVCKSCGKILEVPDSGIMTCSNPHCASLLYPRIDKFCKVLDLPELTKPQFDAYMSNSELQILPDLLLLPEYKDLKIKKNLWELIYACIPIEAGVDKQWIIRFCNRCNNNYKTVKYYFDSPVRIYTELDMNVSRRLADWLSDAANVLEVDTVINSAQIEISAQDKIMSFDGAPIFRNKTIFITGTFKHGTMAEIRAILESYSATVVTDYDDYIQCVLVGDIKDGIDGQAILAARELKLPIFNESEFFARYSIDEDLEKFLL